MLAVHILYVSFFKDSDVVSRGDLRLPTYRNGQSDYFHSWIELTHEGIEYVFDPALNDLRKKADYYKEFSAKIRAKVEVEKTKKLLIDYVNNNEKECIYFPGSVYIEGSNKVEEPFFRTNSRVVEEIELIIENVVIL